MLIQHKIILCNSQQIPEIDDSTDQLMITSQPYPLIKTWDAKLQDYAVNLHLLARIKSQR